MDKELSLRFGDTRPGPFLNAVGIYQDGTVPFCRDADGTLWAIAGHSNIGHIGMFRGSTLEDITEAYPIDLNFSIGHADYAFSGICYPEGVRPRGSIWPFGLYICPRTHRFFAFFHNESGWNGRGTAYDAFGPCEAPHYDSDFRHVGLMHSDDEGRTWTFDRWVLTAAEPCFTEAYHPAAGAAVGQPVGVIGLGSGDFSLFAPADSEYLYLVYNIIRLDMDTGRWLGCDVYLARTPKRTDGLMGDFVKYYNGSFCEAGNLGRETPIVENGWHAGIVRSQPLGCWLMASVPVGDDPERSPYLADLMELRRSDDLLHWSDPQRFEKDGKPFGNHYVKPMSYHAEGDPFVLRDGRMTILTCHNGTDVSVTDAEIG